MAVHVYIPTALQQYAGNNDKVEVDGGTVGEALRNLVAIHGGLKTHLFDDDGSLRNFVNVFVNNENVSDLQNEKTPLNGNEEVMIVPAVAGGQETIQMDAPAADVQLSPEEIERYSRHLIMPEVGMEGQKKLKKASVLCVGTGGLGSPLAMYLAAAGVGRLGLVDFDVVDASNLQRQIIHGTSTIGVSKLKSATDRIADINPHVRVDGYETALTSENALEILAPYDIVVDGTDNFPTRYLVNDACVLLGKPNVYGSIFRFEGQASFFHAKEGPCYRCLFRQPPPPGLVPSCAEGGVLGILPGIIGVIQATEAVKHIIGKGTSLMGRLLLFDALKMQFRELKIKKNPNCPICGENPEITELIDYQEFCGIGGADDKIDLPETAIISVTEVKLKLDNNENFTLVDVREPHEWDICNIPAATLIPKGDVEKRIGELNRDDEIVVHCRSGVRSGKVVKLLREAGFKNVRNMAGGVLAWADEVDPAMPKY